MKRLAHVTPDIRCHPGRTYQPRRFLRAFTLLELLVVISIIALLASLSLPAIKSINKSNLMVAASRQLLDDLGLARLTAINERTTVYVVFVPEDVFTITTASLTVPERFQLNTLIAGQYTDYALYAPRSVGDQPGSDYGRYVTEWKSLPDGVFIPPNKFSTPYPNPDLFTQTANPNIVPFAKTNFFPFPDSTSAVRWNLPYVAFNSLGQLVPRPGSPPADEIIPLTRGSIFNDRNAAGNFLRQAASVIETPPLNHLTNYNHIHINWLTGRAKLIRPEFQ